MFGPNSIDSSPCTGGVTPRKETSNQINSIWDFFLFLFWFCFCYFLVMVGMIYKKNFSSL